jgi:two-component system, NtrC family, nitrogen regulation sensor histidine kinase GlnL
MSSEALPGLDLLATATVLLDERLQVKNLNLAAETLFGMSRRAVLDQPFDRLFADINGLGPKMASALAETRGFWDQSLEIVRATGEVLHLNCLATPIEFGDARLLLELRQIDQLLRVERETLQLTQSQANRELIRNLAHEIKNPLGGLRGSAQLLERELERPDLREYTQVIIKEADRLQSLMERLLTPNRLPQMDRVNIHEVCERVRSLVLAEYPRGIRIRRDYDTSLPELVGDREQLIQAVLNIARNAAQALTTSSEGKPPIAFVTMGEITLRTRVVFQVTIARARYRLALELQVLDNGPGIPEAIRDRVFYPLVSGREGGTGLGLTLAQTYVQYHHGMIECESQPGRTAFRILLPIGPEIAD